VPDRWFGAWVMERVRILQTPENRSIMQLFMHRSAAGAIAARHFEISAPFRYVCPATGPLP